jgi:hypothetical protein
MLALQLVGLLSDRTGLAHDVTLLVPRPRAGSVGDSVAAADRSYRVETYEVRRRNLVAGLLSATLRGRPLQGALFHHPDLRRRVRSLAPSADLVILQLARLAEYIDDVADTPVLVDLVDSLALNFERRSQFDRRWRRSILRFEARRLLRTEKQLLDHSVAGLLVSERDRSWLVDRVGREAGARLAVIPVVTSASESTATARGVVASSTRQSGERLAFTGNLGYFVNDDAIRWWLREVWPSLHQKSPEIGLTIAGARPKRGLRRLARSASGDVELIASPRDLGAVLATACVSIAPMRAGSGVPVKVLEAWASGVPVVASPWAAAGAAGRHDEDLLIAQTASEWCEAVIRLIDDRALSERLARAGRRRVQKDHSVDAARAAIESVFWRAGLS